MRIGSDSIFALAALSLAGCVCGPVVVDDTVRLPCCRISEEIHSVNISTGIAPWRVRRIEGGGSEEAIRASDPTWIAAPHRDGEWQRHGWSPFVAAEWVGPPRSVGAGPGSYEYILPFIVPRCRTGDGSPPALTVRLRGWLVADDSADMHISGPGGRLPVPVATSTGPMNLGAVNEDTDIENAGPGIYTLTVTVRNAQGPSTGMLLQGMLNTICAAQ